MSKPAGSEIKIGESVIITIKNGGMVDTKIIGRVAGIRFWSENELAFEIEGITAEWFVINDKRKIEAV